MTDETPAATPDHGLHQPDFQGRRHYCGPTAIAAITGAPFETVYKKIRRLRSDMDKGRHGRRLGKRGRNHDINGRKIPIKGMTGFLVVETMKRFGFKVKASGGEYPSLAAFLEDRGHCSLMIVSVTDHFIAVSRGVILDTLTKGQPVPMMDYKRLRTRVEKWWQFE